MKTIRDYYVQANLPDMVLKTKISEFEKHNDIAAEFAEWIETGKYRDNGVAEQGYTAKLLSELSPFLDGEGAFTLLIQLRENPTKTLKKLDKGYSYFKIR